LIGNEITYAADTVLCRHASSRLTSNEVSLRRRSIGPLLGGHHQSVSPVSIVNRPVASCSNSGDISSISSSLQCTVWWDSHDFINSSSTPSLPTFRKRY